MMNSADSIRTSGAGFAVASCLAYVLLLQSGAVSAAVEFTDRAPAAGVAAPGESYGASWGDPVVVKESVVFECIQSACFSGSTVVT